MADKLSEEFFAQPQGALGDEALQLIYSEAVAHLRHENPTADTLETMWIERTVAIYTRIRNKETLQSFDSDKTYLELMKLWVTLASALQKKRLDDLDVGEIRDRILAGVQVAVSDAMKASLPADLAEAFGSALLQELDEVTF